MQVGLVLSSCLILNRIQTLCLFKGASPKVPRHFNQLPHALLGEPHTPLFSSTSLLPWSFNAPSLGALLLPRPKGVGHPLYVLVSSPR